MVDLKTKKNSVLAESGCASHIFYNITPEPEIKQTVYTFDSFDIWYQTKTLKLKFVYTFYFLTILYL